MKTLLWLDDLRNPFLNKEGKVPEGYDRIIWVRNFDEFEDYLIDNHSSMPDAISFDHDLHPEHYTPEFFWNNYELSKQYQTRQKEEYRHETGEGCAEWLVMNCDPLPKCYIHSSNPVGEDWIREVLGMSKIER